MSLSQQMGGLLILEQCQRSNTLEKGKAEGKDAVSEEGEDMVVEESEEETEPADVTGGFVPTQR